MTSEECFVNVGLMFVHKYIDQSFDCSACRKATLSKSFCDAGRLILQDKHAENCDVRLLATCYLSSVQ